MDNLLEAVTADTVAHEAKRAARHSLPIGAPCPNCRTALAGPWCYACGQRGEEFHRSIWRLAGEAFEGLTDFDGRIWRTLPRLVLQPGKLTREYLEGRRAAQLPPFRLFLIVLVLVFFAGGLNANQNREAFRIATLESPEIQQQLAPKDRADLQKTTQVIRGMLAKPKTTESASTAWVRQHLLKAMDNKEAFKAAIGEWAQRFAILMLPIAALLLSVLFLFKKGVYVFDHLIFSMHSLAFQGLLLSTMFLAGVWLNGPGWLLLASPVHLFVHMRGAYRTGVAGTLLRMFVLFIGSIVAFALLITGLLFVGLASVK